MPVDPPRDSIDHLLSQALRHHRGADLSAAEKLYQQILSRRPDHSDAQHLLGVIAHQRGDHRRALELIESAIARCGNVATYHANLGEVHRALGQFDQAAACQRRALQIDPRHAAAANNLGMALLGQGATEQAIEQFRFALTLNPDHAEAHNNLGMALGQQDRHDEAIAHFRHAVRLNPALASAHAGLGQALLERGDTEAALQHCRRAIELAPGAPESYNNLGNVLRKTGQLSQAIECYVRAHKLDPKLAMPLSNLGQAFEEQGQAQEALAWYRRALERDPRSPRIRCNLARVVALEKHFEQAAEQYEQALQVNPDHAESHDGLAALYCEQGRLDDAMAQARHALRLRPDFPSAHVNMGHAYEQMGDAHNAEACFRQAFRCDANFPAAYVSLANLMAERLPPSDIDAMRRLIDAGHLSPPKQGDLHFALAQALDARDDFVQAALHAEQANALRDRFWKVRVPAYDPDVHSRLVDRIIQTFDPSFFDRTRGWGSTSDVPVFHVGLPRSGKTLAEQILAAHPALRAAGELRLVEESLESIPKILGMTAAPIDCVDRLTEAAVAQLAQRHLTRLQSPAPGATRVIDTMPQNYLWLGLVAVMFPQAKIVHCRRDLRDLAVSCRLKDFKNLAWVCDKTYLARRMADYRRVMEHWADVLPVEMLEVEYEQVITDEASASGRLFDFVGLPKTAATPRAIRSCVSTRHLDAVLTPLNNSGVGRWRFYARELGDLFTSLPVAESRKN